MRLTELTNKGMNGTPIYEPLKGEVGFVAANDLAKTSSHRRRYAAKWLEKAEE